MDKREFKLLLRDHDKLDGDAVSYVHSRINNYVMRCERYRGPVGVVLFCLAECKRTDPLLLHVRRWIDEANGGAAPPCRTAAYLAKVCVVCGMDGAPLQSCARCRSVYYGGKSCQVSDWSAHKAECKAPRPTMSVITAVSPSGSDA